MTLRRRVRRLALLVCNAAHCVRFAGGLKPFLATILVRLVAGEWQDLVSWLTAPVCFGERGNARLYRRWLTGKTPAGEPDGPVLALVSAVGVPTVHQSAYLRLLSGSRRLGSDLVVLIDATLVDRAAARLDVSGDLGAMQFVGVGDASPNAMIDVMRSRLLDDQAGRGENRSYRYVAIFPPGYIPGDMPFLAGEANRLIYGDEDVMDIDGNRSQPYFKPGFSPDLLLHSDYVSPGMAMTTELALKLPDCAIGDFHSLSLMLAEHADRVEHVDGFLAHRLLTPKPTPKPSGAPAFLPEFLGRRYGARATVSTHKTDWTCHFGCSETFVSVIVPTRDRVDLLATCIEGVYATNTTGTFEVVVVDNGSTQAETHEWLRNAKSRWKDFHVVDAPEPFNWCRLNNLGMEQAAGDVFVFLNNDTESMHADWLARLADVASRPDVGAVGALLLYPNGRIQHAGVVTGFGDCADHIYRGFKPGVARHLFVPPTVPRNVTAVTGACLAIARTRIEAIGPFDEEYQVAGGDVELCVRAMASGLLNVYLPDVRLIHHESQSRSRRDPEADVRRLKALVADSCPSDPYYNRNLSLASLYPSYPL